MTRAIILVDHGSRVPEANRLLDEVAELLGRRTTDRIYVAHMELAEPTLTQAFAAAAGEGADRVYVFPYFLAPGRHSTDDIPRQCEQAARAAGGVAFHCGEPIGLEPELAALILRRAAACPSSAYQSPRESTT